MGNSKLKKYRDNKKNHKTLSSLNQGYRDRTSDKKLFKAYLSTA